MSAAVKVDARKLRAFQRQLPRAIARAINKSAVTVRATAAREISADLGLRVGDVREQLKLERATAQNPEATISIRGERIPLIRFGARQTRRGVTYRLRKGRGRVPRGFIATMRSGHRGVFVRISKKRLPIRELYGPSLPLVFSRSKIERAMQERYADAMARNLPHEIEFELSRLR